MNLLLVHKATSAFQLFQIKNPLKNTLIRTPQFLLFMHLQPPVHVYPTNKNLRIGTGSPSTIKFPSLKAASIIKEL